MACPGSSARTILQLRGDRAPGPGAGAHGRDRPPPDRRRAARAPRVPAARRRCSRGSRASRTCRSPPTATCSSATPRRWSTRASRASTCRSTRSSATASSSITRRDSLPQVLRGLEAIGAHPEVRPIKVNAVALRGFTEQEALPFAEFARSTSYQVRFIEFMPLDGDHAWTRDRCCTGDEIRAIIDARPPARGAAARAALDGARVPLRRRPRRDRLHQPGLRALLRRLQPHPPDRRRQAPHLPVLASRDRPARAAARRARATRTSRP